MRKWGGLVRAPEVRAVVVKETVSGDTEVLHVWLESDILRIRLCGKQRFR